MEENKNSPELLYVVDTSKLNFIESVFCAAFFAGACAYVLGPLLEQLTFVQPYILKIRLCLGAVFSCVFLAILSPFLSYGICQEAVRVRRPASVPVGVLPARYSVFASDARYGSRDLREPVAAGDRHRGHNSDVGQPSENSLQGSAQP